MPLPFFPSFARWTAGRHLVRIPHECDVPLTDRVRQLLDAPEMRRLARISQLAWWRSFIRGRATRGWSIRWASIATL